MSIGDLNRPSALTRLPQTATQSRNIRHIASNPADVGGVTALMDASRNPVLGGFHHALQPPPTPLAQRQVALNKDAAPDASHGAQIPTSTAGATPPNAAVNRNDISFLIGDNHAPQRGCASLFATIPPVIPEKGASAAAANRRSNAPVDQVPGAPLLQGPTFLQPGPFVAATPQPFGVSLPNPSPYGGGVNIHGNVTFNFYTAAGPTPSPSEAIDHIPLIQGANQRPTAPDAVRTAKRKHEDAFQQSARGVIAVFRLTEESGLKERLHRRPEEKEKIRALARAGMTPKTIAAQYGISTSSARNIIIGKTTDFDAPTLRRRKVTDEQVREIRDLYSAGTKQLDLANQFKVSISTINRVVNGQDRFAVSQTNDSQNHKGGEEPDASSKT